MVKSTPQTKKLHEKKTQQQVRKNHSNMKKVNLNNLELSSKEIDVLKMKSDRRKNKQIMKKKRRIFYEKNNKKTHLLKKKQIAI